VGSTSCTATTTTTAATTTTRAPSTNDCTEWIVARDGRSFRIRHTRRSGCDLLSIRCHPLLNDDTARRFKFRAKRGVCTSDGRNQSTECDVTPDLDAEYDIDFADNVPRFFTRNVSFYCVFRWRNRQIGNRVVTLDFSSWTLQYKQNDKSRSRSQSDGRRKSNNGKNSRGIFALGICSNVQSAGQIALETIVLGFFALRVVLAVAHHMKERGSIVLPSVWLESWNAFAPLHVWIGMLWPFHVMSGPLQAAQALAHVSCVVFVCVALLHNPLMLPFANGMAMWAFVGICAAAVAAVLRLIVHHVSMLHSTVDKRNQFHVLRKSLGAAPDIVTAALTCARENRRRAHQFVAVRDDAEELEKEASFNEESGTYDFPSTRTMDLGPDAAACESMAASPRGSFQVEDSRRLSNDFAGSKSMCFTLANARLPPPQTEPCCSACPGNCWMDCVARLAHSITHFAGVPLWWLGASRPMPMRARPSPVTSVRVENAATHFGALALCLALFVMFTAVAHNMNKQWCDAHIRILNGSIFMAVIFDVLAVQPLCVGAIALYRYIMSEDDPDEDSTDCNVICHEAYPVPYEWRYLGLPPPLPLRRAAAFRVVRAAQAFGRKPLRKSSDQDVDAVPEGVPVAIGRSKRVVASASP